MNDFIAYGGDDGLNDDDLYGSLWDAVQDCEYLKKILLLPPDHTRYHSGAGKITQFLYDEFHRYGCAVDVMPALGTHAAMTREECAMMFPRIPFDEIIVHNWREDVVKLGEVPASFVSEVSGGLVNKPIAVELNKRLLDPSYDLIISIGQVVPHEVAGMANRNKNLFVGCGGADMINSSHMLGAFYGMERIMGRDHTPVRKVFDYAEEHFYKDAPLNYILTVTTQQGEDIAIHGLFIGRERHYFEDAVKMSREKNLTLLDRPIDRAIVFLDEREFKTTWLGNKAIYRTRMAIADGGELIILAPGVSRFGEDMAIDALIRKYGYRGREYVLDQCKTREDLNGNLSAAAHLIHGSSDGRFTITYCTQHISKAEVEGVGFKYMPYDEAAGRYYLTRLKDGYNRMPDGEDIYYISNPALGLWADKGRFFANA